MFGSLLNGRRLALACVALAGCIALGVVVSKTLLSAQAQTDAAYEVVRRFPHDPKAYTQGLAFQGERFFEGTGLNGSSWLRRVALQTGKVKKQRALAEKYFGEGITILNGKIYQLTWQHERAFVYDAKTFKRLKTFNYNEDPDATEEGWGLADNGRILAMSDGTEFIRFRNPRTFEVTREITVTENGTVMDRLNELEWIGDEIFANVYGEDYVLRIDPQTGAVVDRFDLGRLREREVQTNGCEPEVTNGIAYMASQERLFVTGKWWCHVYEIRLTDPPG